MLLRGRVPTGLLLGASLAATEKAALQLKDRFSVCAAR
jgi:hypothetical protein